MPWIYACKISCKHCKQAICGAEGTIWERENVNGKTSGKTIRARGTATRRCDQNKRNDETRYATWESFARFCFGRAISMKSQCECITLTVSRSIDVAFSVMLLCISMRILQPFSRRQIRRRQSEVNPKLNSAIVRCMRMFALNSQGNDREVLEHIISGSIVDLCGDSEAQIFRWFIYRWSYWFVISDKSFRIDQFRTSLLKSRNTFMHSIHSLESFFYIVSSARSLDLFLSRYTSLARIAYSYSIHTVLQCKLNHTNATYVSN